MKLTTLSIIIFLNKICYGQHLPLHLNNDTSYYNNQPVYVLLSPGKLPVKVYDIRTISPQNIISIKIFQKPDTTKYAMYSKTSVILIQVNEKQKISVPTFTSYKEVLDKYKIKQIDRILPPYIDSVYCNHPERRQFVMQDIKAVTVENEIGSGIRFIDITTRYPPPKMMKEWSIKADK